MPDRRADFLLTMYTELMNDINRHILVVWQSIGVLVGAFAVFALTEKNLIPLDVAVALIVTIAWWHLAHTIDASFWYNRNLAIIINIERQFLEANDLSEVHWYFGNHRPSKMISHLRIQATLGFVVVALVLIFHLLVRVAPGFELPFSDIDPLRALPYLLAILSLIRLLLQWSSNSKKYLEFVKLSPGREVSSPVVGYGHGQLSDHDPGIVESIKMLFGRGEK